MEGEIASPDTAREKRNSSSSDSSSSTENNDTDSTHNNSSKNKGVYDLGSANSGSDSPAVEDNAAFNSPASAREEQRVTADSEGGKTARAVESNGSKRIVENGRIPTEVSSPDDDDGGVSQVTIRPRSDIVASVSTRSSGKVTPARREAAGLLGKLGLSLHVDSVVVRKRARDKVISEGELHSEIGKLVSGIDENTDHKDNSQHNDQTEDESNDDFADPVTAQEEKPPDLETIDKDISIEKNEDKDSSNKNEEKDDSTEEVEEKDDSYEKSEDEDDSDKDENSEEDTPDNVSDRVEHRQTFPDSVNETVENKSRPSNKRCCCIL